MQRQKLLKHFRDSLAGAQEKRGADYEAWIKYERDVMHNIVNSERVRLNKKPLPVSEVERVENYASGHVDYSLKYSLYCMELVLDRS